MKICSIVLLSCLFATRTFAYTYDVGSDDVRLKFVELRYQGNLKGCGFELEIYDPTSNLLMFHTLMVPKLSPYMTKTFVSKIDPVSHANGQGLKGDVLQKVNNAWMSEGDSPSKESTDLDILGLNRDDFSAGKITTVGVRYLNATTDKDLGLVQTSNDNKLFNAELFIVRSGNFKFGFNIDPKKSDVVFNAKFSPDRDVFHKMSSCMDEMMEDENREQKIKGK